MFDQAFPTLNVISEYGTGGIGAGVVSRSANYEKTASDLTDAIAQNIVNSVNAAKEKEAKARYDAELRKGNNSRPFVFVDGR